MKKNLMPLLLLTLALVLACGLVFTGCGLNQAQGEPIPQVDLDSQEQLLDDRVAESEAERAVLAQRAAEITEQEALLAQQETLRAEQLARAESEAQAMARQPIVLTVPSLTKC